MKATDLANAFEEEWIPRYPHMRQFTVDCAVRDIAHWRNSALPSLAFTDLVSFLAKYLKEHPDRFQYIGNGDFKVLAKLKMV